MDATREYRCTQCGRLTGRKELTVKRVQFSGMGAGARLVRSRVADWLCKSCLNIDDDWNRESSQGSWSANRDA